MSLVELRNVKKSFRLGGEQVEILHGIDLVVEKGEFVAMMGPSGSGKSTTMNILGCLDKPTSGQYFLDGRDVSELNRDELAAIRNSTIGFVFQGFNLLQRTSAVENVELPMLYAGVHAKERRERAKEALVRMGLGERLYHEPSQLSGGQQQRVAIARGIVNHAPILMADEPTGNLDSKTSDEIMRLFQQLNREEGITIILVTHEPDVAAFAGRELLFRDGVILEDRPNEHRRT
ncbi:ABC transporter, ATP-binding protein [Pyramidobacter piscolens W5455]|uniref:ABC transporter, ATP-binding protein n=1 Tax=Pyramidobacter piscolens W5455 TaxID=352165 RepID=A0ABM9ZUE6_9BACT|nr:ABC transporter ATP-binding protein [Pyramidobacter piscolens]EFB90517.1 ABC transporter, ATP-binding protein [Pyramidobacter piscolens W5455]BDF79277.1 macrolide ABC transporter ATP-binding protein [Pyramidobacter piscolens]